MSLFLQKLQESKVKEEFSKKWNNVWSLQASQALKTFLAKQGIDILPSELKTYLLGNSTNSLPKTMEENLTESEILAWQELEESAEETFDFLDDPISAIALKEEKIIDQLNFESTHDSDNLLSKENDSLGIFSSLNLLLESENASFNSSHDSFLFSESGWQQEKNENNEIETLLPIEEEQYNNQELEEQYNKKELEEELENVTFVDSNSTSWLNAEPVDFWEDSNIENMSAVELMAQQASISEVIAFEKAGLFTEEEQKNIDTVKKPKRRPQRSNSITTQFENMRIQMEKAKTLYRVTKKLVVAGKYNKAIKKMEQCLSILPSSFSEEGEKYLEKIKQIAQQEVQEKYDQLKNEGFALLEERKLPEAIAVLSEANDIYPSTELELQIKTAEKQLKNVIQFWENAQLLANFDKNEEALNVLQRCLAIYPNHGSSLELQKILQQKIKQTKPLKDTQHIHASQLIAKKKKNITQIHKIVRIPRCVSITQENNKGIPPTKTQQHLTLPGDRYLEELENKQEILPVTRIHEQQNIDPIKQLQNKTYNTIDTDSFYKKKTFITTKKNEFLQHHDIIEDKVKIDENIYKDITKYLEKQEIDTYELDASKHQAEIQPMFSQNVQEDKDVHLMQEDQDVHLIQEDKDVHLMQEDNKDVVKEKPEQLEIQTEPATPKHIITKKIYVVQKTKQDTKTFTTPSSETAANNNIQTTSQITKNPTLEVDPLSDSDTLESVDEEQIIVTPPIDEEKKQLQQDINIEGNKEKAEVVSKDQKNKQILEEAQQAYKEKNFDRAYKILKQLIVTLYESDPIYIKAKQLQKKIKIYHNSQEALRQLEQIPYYLQTYDVEKIETILGKSIFSKDIDIQVKQKWQNSLNQCLHIATSRASLRKIIFLILSISLFMLQGFIFILK
ncbi:MAG: hypothetical protein KBC30_09550 [Planctomycetes bacterium]|nr:hypothetical protein [Planctomycetota bacterium]HPY75931.1 hypothetical protein [Planctomycetota bacterium]HQB01476.1 hypothetical protein [Planctomycetota bacterium]